MAIQKVTRDPVLVVDGSYVSERDREFEGATGKTFKDLVEWAATEVGMNPGLLAAIALAEWDKRALYLGTGEVPSFQSGSDDFFASRATLARNVPAFSKVKFNAKQLFKDINEQQRLVTTVLFKSGKDALLGTAVYAKNGELKVRKGAARNGGDFDTMPIETQFALVRIAMGAGHGGITWNGDFNWVKLEQGREMDQRVEGRAGRDASWRRVDAEPRPDRPRHLHPEGRTTPRSVQERSRDPSQRHDPRVPGAASVRLGLRQAVASRRSHR